MKIPVLFTKENSNYIQLGADCYNKERNALTFPGGTPLIAHPPCRAWSRLSAFSKHPTDEPYFGIWAIIQVRKYGGIVEHPASSKLWKFMDLPTGNRIDEFGGFTLSVDQSWWGHPARKPTFLYIVGIKPNEIPGYSPNFIPVKWAISSNKEKSTEFRNYTPIEFCKFLLKIVEIIQVKSTEYLNSTESDAGMNPDNTN